MIGGETVTVVTPALVADGHGNQVPDWTSTTEVAVTGCSVQPGATSEDDAGRIAVTVRWTIYAPGAPAIGPGDRVRVRGTLYDVDGQPAAWASPTGSLLAHTVILAIDRRG